MYSLNKGTLGYPLTPWGTYTVPTRYCSYCSSFVIIVIPDSCTSSYPRVRCNVVCVGLRSCTFRPTLNSRSAGSKLIFSNRVQRLMKAMTTFCSGQMKPHTIPHSHTHICACHTRTYPHPQYSHSHSSSHSHPQSPASLLSSLSLWSVPQPLLLEPLHSHLCNSNVTLGQGRGNRAPDVCQRTKGLPLCSRPTDASS